MECIGNSSGRLGGLRDSKLLINDWNQHHGPNRVTKLSDRRIVENRNAGLGRAHKVIGAADKYNQPSFFLTGPCPNGFGCAIELGIILQNSFDYAVTSSLPVVTVFKRVGLLFEAVKICRVR